VHEEGYRFGLFPLAGALAAGVAGAWWASAAGLAVAVAVWAFFRDPERNGTGDPDAILAPADGKVVAVAPMGGGWTRISIFMNLHNVHVNRSPVAGEVSRVRYRPGRYLAAWAPKASEINEANTVAILHPRGEVRMTQIAGLVARRILCWTPPGTHLAAGERFGLIRFGSRVDLDLPQDAVRVEIRVGTRVRAGESVVARWQ